MTAPDPDDFEMTENEDASVYEGTDFKMVISSHPNTDEVKYILGIINTVDGKGFGWYADCGVVHSHSKNRDSEGAT